MELALRKVVFLLNVYGSKAAFMERLSRMCKSI